MQISGRKTAETRNTEKKCVLKNNMEVAWSSREGGRMQIGLIWHMKGKMASFYGLVIELSVYMKCGAFG
jgi:hypothetical protein